MAMKRSVNSCRRLIGTSCLIKDSLLSLESVRNFILDKQLVYIGDRGNSRLFSTCVCWKYPLSKEDREVSPKCEWKKVSDQYETLQNVKAKLSGQFVAKRSHLWNTTFKRQFGTTVNADSQYGMGRQDSGRDDDRVVRHAEEKADWGVRLANDNGYLSWCRNTYLTTVVAIAMMGEGTTYLAQQAAEGAFFVAGLNLIWGTSHYIYNIVHLRPTLGMSRLGGLMHICLALIHMVLWLMICLLYIGYTEDPDMKVLEEELHRQSKQKKD